MTGAEREHGADGPKLTDRQQESLCEHGSVIEQTPEKMELVNFKKSGSTKKKDG